MKPAIFIDAFLSDEKRHELFNYNVTNFIKNDWDVFIISNKIARFDSFSGVKYFEYDCTNRITPNNKEYYLPSSMILEHHVYDDHGNTYRCHGYAPINSFSNWTLLYNLRRMAEIVKQRGYTHLIACEYDLIFKRYDLMNTVFKRFDETGGKLKCMVSKGSFGWSTMTSLYLISTDLVLDTVPVLNTEDDYKNFMVKIYGHIAAPVYEEIFNDIFITNNPGEVEIIPEEVINEAQDRSQMLSSSNNDFRTEYLYNYVIFCPVNNNTQFFIYHVGDTPTYVEYTTEGYSTIIKLHPRQWHLYPCTNYVRVQTSDMIAKNIEYNYDLVNTTHHFTFTQV